MASVRMDTVPMIPGAVVMGVTGLGVLGSQVPATGPGGFPPFGFEDIEAADLDAEVSWEILDLPEAGTLEVFEDSSFLFTGAPPGTYSFHARPRRWGQPLPVKLVVIVVGAEQASVSARLDIA